MASEPVVLGRISGLFGVRGWIKVYSYTEPREAVLKYKSLLTGRDGNWCPAKVAEGQRHGKTVIARFEGVNDRDQAAELVGLEIATDRRNMPEPEKGRYYWSDIIGLAVSNRDGTELGSVRDMLETGAHDVMVVTGEQDRLIPFVVDEVVVSVDLENGRIVVDWEWD